MAPALDRLGGEVVRLRSRDGLRLTGRFLLPVADELAASGAPGAPAEAPPAPAWVPDPREAILLLHG